MTFNSLPESSETNSILDIVILRLIFSSQQQVLCVLMHNSKLDEMELFFFLFLKVTTFCVLITSHLTMNDKLYTYQEAKVNKTLRHGNF